MVLFEQPWRQLLLYHKLLVEMVLVDEPFPSKEHKIAPDGSLQRSQGLAFACSILIFLIPILSSYYFVSTGTPTNERPASF